jgi:endogenous inhibitor of DNA gyrase (YacG/DUF329 family)
MSPSDPKPAKVPSCAICGRPVEPQYRPFCSRRCADVDLSRWLSNRYAVAAVEDEETRDGALPDEPDD